MIDGYDEQTCPKTLHVIDVGLLAVGHKALVPALISALKVRATCDVYRDKSVGSLQNRSAVLHFTAREGRYVTSRRV